MNRYVPYLFTLTLATVEPILVRSLHFWNRLQTVLKEKCTLLLYRNMNGILQIVLNIGHMVTCSAFSIRSTGTMFQVHICVTISIDK